MAGRFSGKVAFVTGGSGGLERESLNFLPEEGAKVAFIDLNEEALAATTNELREKGYDQFFQRWPMWSMPKQVEGAIKEVYRDIWFA